MKHIEPRCICLGNICGGGYEKNIEQSRRVYDSQGLCPTLPAHTSEDSIIKIMEMKIIENTKQGYTEADDGDYINLSFPQSETRRGRVGHGVAQTLLTSDGGGILLNEDLDIMRIRKLTPREYWRLMDFDDEDYNKASEVVSETQLYKQAGNSIVVNCLVAIFGQMFEGKEDVYKEK